jgi:isoleucyl-tRNA synthetase
VEKELGISGKPEIEALGVANFNRRCRDSVWKYRAEWERMVERIAHWMDYDRPYVTYTNEYMESEWWALKTLHERGLLYRGHKILPYCARCGTALSSHEVAQGYEDVEDPSVFIAVDLLAEHDGGTAATRRRLIVWTTTPWTLVSNVALAVHPELTYVELRKRNATADGWTIILAEARAGALLGEDYTDRWETVSRLTGVELVGRRYRRPLDWVAFDADAGQHEVIVAGEFVSADDGSGIVHMAPAFGADDYAMGQKHGLAMLQPVTARGTFADNIPVVGGVWVKDADARIIEELARRDVLWKAGTLMHSYPHCWRCNTPLLYFARVSWFIRTSSYKDDMLARNARMAWYPPEVGEGRFGEWLKNNVDWAISRDRFWGTPLPVWVCEQDDSHVDVIGSYAELADRAGTQLPGDFDPHKPFVDQYRWPCTRCRGTSPVPSMVRVNEVIDAWFDSGSMPFAQWHYPFENRETLAEQYPADFIAEGLDQTRGWFYSLLAIAAGLGDALPNNGGAAAGTAGGGKVAPYSAVVVNDLVLDATGVKMSKSRGNVVNPWDVIEEFGADAVRLFLVSSSQLGTPKLFDTATIRDSAARFLVTLKNVYSGIFAQYANFGWIPSEHDPDPAERPLIDRWVLSRAASIERDVDGRLAAFDATAAARMVMSFVVDDVSNWYVRLNRARFFDVDKPDNRAAFATLHTVLTVTTRLLAPVAPFLSDWMHRQLQGTSVHLADFVRVEREDILPTLEAAMDEIRVLSRLGRAAREDAGIAVRRPLSRLLCVVPPEHVEGVLTLLPLLKSELNVKDVSLLTSADELVTLEAKPNFRSLGKRFGKSTPLAAKAVEALSGEHLRAFERGEALAISVEGETRHLEVEDLTIVRRASGDLVVKEGLGRFAAIDPSVTPALRQEGLAREFVSRVQRSRKDADLAVSDRIRLAVDGAQELNEAVAEYKDWIAGEVLAVDIVIGGNGFNHFPISQTADIDGYSVRFALTTEI